MSNLDTKNNYDIAYLCLAFFIRCICFPFQSNCNYKRNCFIIEKEAAIKNQSIKQVFRKNAAALIQCQKKALKNKYEGVHFSKVAGLLFTNLQKMISFTGIFQLFSNINTNIYFAEQVPLATHESISYKSIKSY